MRKPRPRAGLSSGSSRFEKEPEPLKKAAADLEPPDGNKRMPGCQLFELIVPAEDGGAIGAAVAIDSTMVASDARPHRLDGDPEEDQRPPALGQQAHADGHRRRHPARDRRRGSVRNGESR